MIWHPSPNFGPRRDGLQPELVVLHFTAMHSAEAALARLCDPGSEVSAHYLIGATGQLWQMVQEDQRAWHAGAGCWGGRADVNSRSIGIELDNSGREPFAAAQMDCLEGLLAEILQRWRLSPDRVIGHSDMAPLRKTDPGRHFDWHRLARQGLAVWPMDRGDAAADFLRAAEVFGYTPPVAGEQGRAAVLEAFRQRFRPWASGPETEEDRAAICDLARRYPVDAPSPRA